MANNWTYFILDNDTGEIKIGQSINPFDRLKNIKGSDPNRNNLELIAMFPDHSLEREFHDRFEHLRVSGEWFTPGEELSKFLDRPHELSIQVDELPIIEEEEEPFEIDDKVIVKWFQFMGGLIIAVIGGWMWGLIIMAGTDTWTIDIVVIATLCVLGGIASALQYAGYQIKLVGEYDQPAPTGNGHK